MQGSSPSTTAHLPPKADKSWLGRMRSTKNLKPSAPQGVIPIWQIKWVVYVTGRRYCICYQLDQAFREARILINDVEIMRKTYKALERVSACLASAYKPERTTFLSCCALSIMLGL